jgi:bifunctional non-homologous end joining protein LigD
LSSRVTRLYARRPLLARAGFTKSSSTVTARRRISENGCPAIYTRRAYDWTLRFRTIADALAALPADDLIPDGEALVADSRGVPDFGLLHADPAAGRKDRLLYYAFDLLYLDGFDLRGARLAERKRLLAELLADASERILFAEHLEGEGAQIQERAGAMGVIVETQRHR